MLLSVLRRCIKSPLSGRTLVQARSFSSATPDLKSHLFDDNAPRIMITGCLGQIGSDLVSVLRAKYGSENVIATDIKKPSKASFLRDGPFLYADVLDYSSLSQIVVEHRIDWLIHNSSILSATGELHPQLALDVNVKGIQNALELARNHNLRILAPSSIAAFGPSTPKEMTPDSTIMRPSTVYGLTKVHLELLGEYYFNRYGVDFRSLRYPGVISSEALPGGGTTDYAVDIFYYALRNKPYECFLSEHTKLPMLYMPDTIRATIELLEAPSAALSQRVYNVNGISFTPEEIYKSIQQSITDFKISYKPDFRQRIADSWPHSLDDSAARKDWGWKPEYDLDRITKDMIDKLRKKVK